MASGNGHKTPGEKVRYTRYDALILNAGRLGLSGPCYKILCIYWYFTLLSKINFKG